MKIISNEDTDDIASWLPNGKGFCIHDKKRFETELLPSYLKESKYSSFTRRMKRWGFTLSMPKTRNKASYFHPQFIRERIELCSTMRPTPQRNYLRKGNERFTSRSFTTAYTPAHITPELNTSELMTGGFRGGSDESLRDCETISSAALPMTRESRLTVDDCVVPIVGSSIVNNAYLHQSYHISQWYPQPPVMGFQPCFLLSEQASPQPQSLPLALSADAIVNSQRQCQNLDEMKILYDMSLAEVYIQHQALLANQVQLSHYAFSALAQERAGYNHAIPPPPQGTNIPLSNSSSRNTRM